MIFNIFGSVCVAGGQKKCAVPYGPRQVYKGEIEEKLSRSNCCISTRTDYPDCGTECQHVRFRKCREM
ncbi:Uncharacterized protein ChrSV_4342 [Chromobacterium vaccinii]|nr:Uncharacterized protein ChrSW_4342 [Chromobacterium vaccinii]QND91799.1 Uncharacterized protein ChrSV_4342 [Chromobacterium vaccinii]